jgi:hypothetical protein
MYGDLLYKNLNAYDYSQAKIFRVGSEQAGGIFVSDSEVKSNSGTSNQVGGYKQTIHQFDVAGETRIKSDKVTTKRIANTTSLNPISKTAAGDGKVKIEPISSGNSHQNSLRAKQQNSRVHLLLSSSVSLLTPFDPDVELLDPVHLDYNQKTKNGDLKNNAEISGFYVVAGKSIIIMEDLNYYERYQIIRDGTNVPKGGTV